MQPYRQTKPHIGGNCPDCRFDAPGHQQCQHDVCDEIAEAQHRRHATGDEYAALPEAFQPIDGTCHQAVFTCFDHEPDPICSELNHGGMYYVESAGIHGADGLQVLKAATPQSTPCPKCHAQPGDPCLKANGKPRTTDHKSRGTAAPPPRIAACSHVHREDCGGQDLCQCSPDDIAPERPRRIVTPPPLPGPAPIHMPTTGTIANLLGARGIDISRVLTLDIRPDGEGGHVLHAVMAVLNNQGHHEFDDHGRLLTETADLPFVLIGPTSPAQINIGGQDATPETMPELWNPPQERQQM